MAPSPRPTYVFENDKAYAFVGGKVVASADSIEELQKLTWNDQDDADYYADSGGRFADPHSLPSQSEHDDPNSPYYDPTCPKCGAREGAFEDQQHCMACGHDAAAGQMPPTGEMPEPSHPTPHPGPMSSVVTPGGLKGKILGSTKDLWDREQVTVRLENGHIAHLNVGEFQYVAADAPQATVVETLRERLAATVEHDKDSLVARVAELRAVKAEASAAVSEASEQDAAALDSIVAAATYEIRTASDALDYLTDAEYESFIPEAPFQSSVVEQASVGGHTSGWLDVVAADMIEEAQSTDYQKLLDEGPEAFVASLHEAPLADQGMTLQMAASHVRTRTAGVTDEAHRDRFEAMFLERVEKLRRTELASRKTQTHRQASAERDEFESLPDDVLFG